MRRENDKFNCILFSEISWATLGCCHGVFRKLESQTDHTRQEILQSAFRMAYTVKGAILASHVFGNIARPAPQRDRPARHEGPA